MLKIKENATKNSPIIFSFDLHVRVSCQIVASTVEDKAMIKILDLIPELFLTKQIADERVEYSRARCIKEIPILPRSELFFVLANARRVL